MTENNILAVIPARGGSKGLPGKNLKKVHGLSLTRLAIHAANSCPEITHIALSSDSNEILAEMQGFLGPRFIPINRPAEISGDETADQPVLIHAMEFFQSHIGKVSTVVMLQPTSPVRMITDISECIENVFKWGADSSWTMTRLDPKFHFQKQFEISKSGELKIATERGHTPRRQDLKDSYVRNGVCYAYSPSTVMEDPLLIGATCIPRIVNYPTVDIDTQEDLMNLEESTIFDGRTLSWKS
jgi:CMP-N-acetylneuraminic acid synthetase